MLKDMLGRTLQAGQVVSLHLPQHNLLKVMAVRPVFDPGAPPGTYAVVLQAQINLAGPLGAQLQEVLIVKDAEADTIIDAEIVK